MSKVRGSSLGGGLLSNSVVWFDVEELRRQGIDENSMTAISRAFEQGLIQVHHTTVKDTKDD